MSTDTKLAGSVAAWAAACSRAALVGCALLRTDARDGQVRYLVERAGQLREIRNIDDLEAALAHSRTAGDGLAQENLCH